MLRWLLLTFLVPASTAAQDFDIQFAGSHPPDSSVVELVRRYAPTLMGWSTPAARDSVRRPMVVPGYFYHDMDGLPVGFDELTARHTRNDLRIHERWFYDVVLHQYEHTAVLTLKAWSRGSDKGHPFEGYGSAAMVLTRTAEGWRVVADIMGQEPAPPADAPEGP